MLTEGLGRVLVRNPIFLTLTHLRMRDRGMCAQCRGGFKEHGEEEEEEREVGSGQVKLSFFSLGVMRSRVREVSLM